MMTKRALLILLLTLPLSAGCDGALGMRGVVRDPSGAPLGGATVSLQEREEYRIVAETDSSGAFEYEVVVAPGERIYPVAFDLDGFKTAFAGVPSRLGNHLEVVLEPDSTASASRAEIVDGAGLSGGGRHAR